MNADATAGVHDPALRLALSQHWEWTLSRWPELATRLGDHRYDDQLTDRAPAAAVADIQHYALMIERAEAVGGAHLSDADRITLQLFTADLKASQALTACRMDRWSVGVRDNPVVWMNELAETHPLQSPADGANLIRRYKAMPTAIRDHIAALREGLNLGTVANAESVRRTLKLVEDALALPAARWQVAVRASEPHPGWTTTQSARFAAEAAELAERALRPALRGYADFLSAEVLPRARPDDAAGLSSLPDGSACYAALIEHHTSLALDPAELHAAGLSELDQVHADMRALGARLFGTSDLAAIFKRLREDRSLYFSSSAEVEAKAAEALARAQAAVPSVFEALPSAGCEVRPIPEYEAPFTTIAYYMPAVPDEAPGYYYVNSYAPETRPRYEAEVLAFHESVPGHHLQIAFAQELGELPAFRRHLGSTAFVEGWALYTERLADELGLYSGDLDRMGMLSFDAWRGARLVVDTGIHAFGWSRGQAETFMRANTPLAENNIVNEVDRYISWPGQALAYKVGQREILRLRAESAKALGEKFNIKAFHRTLLSGGAVSLPVLRAQVARWQAAVRQASAAR